MYSFLSLANNLLVYLVTPFRLQTPARQQWRIAVLPVMFHQSFEEEFVGVALDKYHHVGMVRVVCFAHGRYSKKVFILSVSFSMSSMKSNMNSPRVSSMSAAYLYRYFRFAGFILAKCTSPSFFGNPKYICSGRR